MFKPVQIDRTSLRLFQVSISFTWIWTLIIKMTDLTAHYTDLGLMPRSLLDDSHWKFSLNMMSGSFYWQVTVFSIALGAAGCSMFNRKPVLSAIVMWLTCISILSRNELVLNGADHYFAMLLFWNIFLSWSPTREAGGIGYTFQIAMLYFFSALAKIHFEPWRDGTAVRDILSLDILTRPWSHGLASSQPLMNFITMASIGLEFLAPIGLIIGIFSIRIRALTLIFLFFMHAGIMSMLKLYFIPVESMVSLLPFIPASLWGRELRHTGEGSTSPSTVLIGLFCLIFLVWNIHSMPTHPISLPSIFSKPTAAFRLDQDWSFYAPPPTPGFNGWWVIEGLTKDGQRVDAWNGTLQEPIRTKPNVLSAYYPNQHWTAYFINSSDSKNFPMLAGLSRYLCEEWNANPEKPNLREIKIERYFSIYDKSPELQYSKQFSCIDSL